MRGARRGTGWCSGMPRRVCVREPGINPAVLLPGQEDADGPVAGADHPAGPSRRIVVDLRLGRQDRFADYRRIEPKMPAVNKWVYETIGMSWPMVSRSG